MADEFLENVAHGLRTAGWRLSEPILLNGERSLRMVGSGSARRVGRILMSNPYPSGDATERREDSSRDSISDVWGPRTPHAGQWPQRSDIRVVEQPDHWIQSCCVLCSTGCGLDIGVKNGRIVGVRGRTVDRVNRGRLGPKGLHGWEANHSPDRLTQPLLRHNGRLQPVSWDEAMGLLVQRTRDVVAEYTGNAVGFYNSGQLFLEEYYTLAMMAEAGLHTAHLDGNTRLCTATAAQALMQSFGTDGDPPSYTDIDVTDALFLVGHNMAETQTVLWARVLDRLASANRPRLVVMDPRRTKTAQQADVHLMLRPATNLAVLNGLLHLLIKAGHLDEEFIRAHTVGFEDLQRITALWTPERVEEISAVPVRDLEAAADILGTTPTLISTVLQGVYQSWLATASAVQVNNLHLIRGLIGKPGSGPFQMNGQPTAQNTRECGANGEMVAFLNWSNPQHMRRLAQVWNVRPEDIPHATPPTHVMQMMRYIETGSIRLFWVIATNPAVSLPELARVRKLLDKRDLFLVVQDAFLTETAELADLVLPAAMWGEKTGCFTNADRTVHISHKAVEPPGQARADFDIFVEFARRMEFKDKDGQPLIRWTRPEEAFEAFKEITRGRPCDYTGLSYAKLSQGSGVQWPCNDQAPDGTERLYTDGRFSTDAESCEIYGHDLITGAAVEADQYRARNPAGRAVIKAADWTPPPEAPDADYPFYLTTGRIVYHFHTRTKTGRSPALQRAAAEPFVEMCAEDAKRLGVAAGDRVEVASRRAKVEVPVRIGEVLPGQLFMPFHYGYWDKPDHPRAANELTISGFDAVSKQPFFKFAAVRIRKL